MLFLTRERNLSYSFCLLFRIWNTDILLFQRFGLLQVSLLDTGRKFSSFVFLLYPICWLFTLSAFHSTITSSTWCFSPIIFWPATLLSCLLVWCFGFWSSIDILSSFQWQTRLILVPTGSGKRFHLNLSLAPHNIPPGFETSPSNDVLRGNRIHYEQVRSDWEHGGFEI